ncbi:MAG TPA: GDSL-type esterase/lipase family protein [Terriglobia bacterium]|nr:GDSL-type esterase/lipase family protein [Terriglobia bacterium]
MKRREFLASASAGFGLPLATQASAATGAMREGKSGSGFEQGHILPKDYKKEPFKRLVILGESHVEGGPWLHQTEDRYADVVVRLINSCQKEPIEYYNKGIGANAISPRSPGYAQSRKPSALERYRKDVIDLRPDLFILAYGLNDMRAAMPLTDFRDDMATIISNVQKACSPVTVLTTVYYMTGWRSYPPYDKGSVELTLRYNDCIRGLAAEFRCILADIWRAEDQADWLIGYDGVHANKVGQLVIANRVFEAIAQHSSCLTNWTFQQERGTQWTERTTESRSQSGDPFRKTW